MSPFRIGLMVASLVSAGCGSPQASHYAEGAHVCSMVPREYTCECDGKERPATEDEKLAASPCGRVYTMCEGAVSDCKPVGGALPFVIDAGLGVDGSTESL